jgi:predicted glycosyltransferase
MSQRIFIYLGHPAHYHTVSALLPEWEEKGYEPVLLVRNKDVLMELLEGSPYRKVPFPSRKGNSWWSIFISTLHREWKMFRLTVKERPAVLIGTDITIAHAGYWTGVPSILLNEDDTEVVPKLAHLGFRYAKHVVSPRSCNIAPYDKKKRSYEGVHEISYLHPDRFRPNESVVRELYGEGASPYALIRVSALDAHHDKGIGGMDLQLLRGLIERIGPYARVHISSEKELPSDLEAYRLRIPSKDMHHALAFATLLVGDSQTMTAEAAVLGTPSVRFSDLTGRLGYLRSLEEEHGLTFGFRTDQEEEMLKKVESLLRDEALSKKWADKRDAFLEASDDPIDLIRRTVEEEVQKSLEKSKGLL